jgi:hypothetical protein
MQNNRFSSQVLINLEFSRQIIEKFEISNLTKMRIVGAELFHGDKKTDKQT